MSLDYDYNYAAWSGTPENGLATSSAQMSGTSKYYCSADLSVANPSATNNYSVTPLSVPFKTQPAETAWSNAGESYMPTPGTFTINSTTSLMHSKGTTHTLTLYFVNLTPNLTPNTQATVSVNVLLYDMAGNQLNIQPQLNEAPNVPIINENIITITTNQTLYGLQLFTAKTIKLGAIQTANPSSGNTLYLQGFSCTIAPQNSLMYATLRNRLAPTRDKHNLVDTGAIVPSNGTKALHYKRKHGGLQTSVPVYNVTQFGVMDWQTEKMTIESQPYYCTGDTSIVSPSLIGKVVVEKPVKITESSNQSRWQNASSLSTPQFNISDGMYAETLAVFFTPVTHQPFGSPEVQLVATQSSFQMFSGTCTAAGTTQPSCSAINFSAGINLSAGVGTNWSLSTTSTEVTISYDTSKPYNESSLRLLPYMELTLASGGSPPLITQLMSTGHPMQAFCASSYIATSASDITSPCFSYQAVKAAKLVLYTDAYKNRFRFGDADSVFILSNNGLAAQLNATTKSAYFVNSFQKTPSVGTLITEARVSDTSTWYLVDDSEPNATKYSFVEYVPQTGEYPGAKGTSIILLFAQNVGVGGTASGYVSCATAGAGNFAPSAVGPLLTQQEAVAQAVQWGVVQSNIETSAFPLGAGAVPDRALSLFYKDKNMSAAEPWNIGMGFSQSSVDLSTAKQPSLTSNGVDGSSKAVGVDGTTWIGHGVWMPSANATSPLLYDPETLLVQPMDTYNVLQGSGFTQGNAYIQWTPDVPDMTTADATAFASTIIAASHHAQTMAVSTAAAGVELYNALKSASAADLPAAQSAYAQAVADVANAQSQALIAKNANRVQTATNAVASAQASLDAVTALLKSSAAASPGVALMGAVAKPPHRADFVLPKPKALSGGDIAGLVIGGLFVVLVIALLVVYSYKVTKNIASL